MDFSNGFLKSICVANSSLLSLSFFFIRSEIKPLDLELMKKAFVPWKSTSQTLQAFLFKAFLVEGSVIKGTERRLEVELPFSSSELLR